MIFPSCASVLNFWERFIRPSLQVVNLSLLIYLVSKIRVLINEGKADRRARMLAVNNLNVRADELDRRTAEIAEAVRVRKIEEDARLSGRLDNIDDELKKNSELTNKAATASAEAAEVANSVNEKIEKTQQRLLDHVKSGEKK